MDPLFMAVSCQTLARGGYSSELQLPKFTGVRSAEQERPTLARSTHASPYRANFSGPYSRRPRAKRRLTNFRELSQLTKTFEVD